VIDKPSLTDALFALSFTFAIAIPSFLGQDQTMKPLFYALILLPTIGMILARKIQLRSLYKSYPLVFLLPIPLLYWSASNLWSANPDLFLPFIRRSLTTFVFIIAVAHITSRLQDEWSRYLDLALFLVAIGAVVQLLLMWQQGDNHGARWRLGDDSVFSRSLHAAHYAGFFATYGLIRFYQQADSSKHWAYLAALSPCLIYMFMTFSRGPIMSYLLLYLAVSVFWYKKPIHAAFSLILAAGVFFINWDSIIARGVSFRLEIWQGAIDIIRDNVWLGIGFGTPLDVAYGKGAISAPHAHNLFLDAFARSGIVGLLMICAIAIYVGYRAIKAEPKEQIFVATLLFFFASMMTDVHKLVNSPGTVYIIFWLPLTALLVQAANRTSPTAPQEQQGSSD
jgi:O-antigen ligase